MKRLEDARTAYYNSTVGRRIISATHAFLFGIEQTVPTSIREATFKDIPDLVRIDRTSYGDYGASEEYFKQNLSLPKAKILVAEKRDKPYGFAVLQMIEAGKIPDDYANIQPSSPPSEKWVQVSSFTTASNYQNLQEDRLLADAIEKFGIGNGYFMFGTCLSVRHPYPSAFPFWESQGYQKTGTIQWIGSPKEPIDCYFYLKKVEKSFERR